MSIRGRIFRGSSPRSTSGTEPGENHAKQSALAITPASDPIHALQKKSANDALNARAPDVHLSQARPQSVPMLVQFDGTQLTVSATLEYADAVDKLIRVLEANKPLLPQKRNALSDENVTFTGDKEAA